MKGVSGACQGLRQQVQRRKGRRGEALIGGRRVRTALQRTRRSQDVEGQEKVRNDGCTQPAPTLRERDGGRGKGKSEGVSNKTKGELRNKTKLSGLYKTI